MSRLFSRLFIYSSVQTDWIKPGIQLNLDIAMDGTSDELFLRTFRHEIDGEKRFCLEALENVS